MSLMTLSTMICPVWDGKIGLVNSANSAGTAVKMTLPNMKDKTPTAATPNTIVNFDCSSFLFAKLFIKDLSKNNGSEKLSIN